MLNDTNGRRKVKLVYIPYNKPYVSGKETSFTKDVMASGQFAGNGKYTRLCQELFAREFLLSHSFLTHSCSSALEMAAILCELKDDDEVILPSFTYVTTASAFEKCRARLVFADSLEDRPHISPASIRSKITEKTRVLVIVHYAGKSCDMEEIMEIVREHKLILIEDCAHAIGAKYNDSYLGTFGDLSTFSFHETKNIQCGEGGLLVVNNREMLEHADSVWQEGTNRANFVKGNIARYEWVSLGSSYQPPEISAAFLYGQLQAFPAIHQKRSVQWKYYHQRLRPLEDKGFIQLSEPDNESNAHIFYIRCKNEEERDELISWMESLGIMAIFHYLPLHLSPYWLQSNPRRKLPNADKWAKQILRLPLYYNLSEKEQDYIAQSVLDFYSRENQGKDSI